MASIDRKLKTPLVPNYIIFESVSLGRREDGYKEADKISVRDLPEETLRELAAEWTEALIAKSKTTPY